MGVHKFLADSWDLRTVANGYKMSVCVTSSSRQHMKLKGPELYGGIGFKLLNLQSNQVESPCVVGEVEPAAASISLMPQAAERSCMLNRTTPSKTQPVYFLPQ